MRFTDALQIKRGITAIIGSGGKTSLIYRLAEELEGRVIVCTSTQIYPPAHIPVLQELTQCCGIVCVGTPSENGKLSAPKQSFSELASLADYVLVEADGSKHLPIKAHAEHEPVIPPDATQSILVVGASGLNRSIEDAVHRPEIFYQLTASRRSTAQAVAQCIIKEALCDRVLINQADVASKAAQDLASLLSLPVCIASVEKGEIICSY